MEQDGGGNLDKDIIEIDSTTRKRKIGDEWKLEKKHGVTGVWCIHPVQFHFDHQDEMEQMYAELDAEMETRRKELMTPEGAQEIITEILKDTDLYEDEQGLTVVEVFDATVGWSSVSREEIVFKGSDGRLYIAGTSSYSGCFYEPPDYEDWLEDLGGLIDQTRKHVEKFTTVPDERSMYNRSTRQFEIVKFDTDRKRDAEKRRLEGIYRNQIVRLRYLERFAPDVIAANEARKFASKAPE